MNILKRNSTFNSCGHLIKLVMNLYWLLNHASGHQIVQNESSNVCFLYMSKKIIDFQWVLPVQKIADKLSNKIIQDKIISRILFLIPYKFFLNPWRTHWNPTFLTPPVQWTFLKVHPSRFQTHCLEALKNRLDSLLAAISCCQNSHEMK